MFILFTVKAKVTATQALNEHICTPGSNEWKNLGSGICGDVIIFINFNVFTITIINEYNYYNVRQIFIFFADE